MLQKSGWAALLSCLVFSAYGQTEVKKSNVHIGFVYPLSTNGLQAPEYSNNASVHMILGVSGSENAFCASGVSNVIRHDAKGVVVAGFSNHVGGQAEGLQAAGFINTTGGSNVGVQAAGFANISGNVQGVQAAGFLNIARNAVAAIQAAGFINVSKDAGSQAAGFANVARDVPNGVQAAGFINVGRDVHTQVAGFINIARKVRGVQLGGFLNIAEESDFPIGIVNIVRKGEKAIGVTVDETGTALLSFRSGGRFLYGILGAGCNMKEEKLRYGLEAGLGAHLPLGRHFRINAEASSLALTDFKKGSFFRSGIRILPALKLGDRLEVFAGPSFNFAQYERDKGKGLVEHYLWEDREGDDHYGLFIGGMAGLQLHL